MSNITFSLLRAAISLHLVPYSHSQVDLLCEIIIPVVYYNTLHLRLVGLNANMRRIDLICKLLAPAAAGAILQFTGPLTTTIVVASWNVVSFSAELGLIWLVYRWVPALAVKKLRKSAATETADEPLIEDAEEGEAEEGALGEGEEMKIFDDEKEKDKNTQVKIVKSQAGSATSHPTWCSRLLAPMLSLRYGWSTYWRQEIALAGVSMAVIYLTVLGFSGVTAGYFLTQGLPNFAIGAGQGVGAILGVAGTIAYPSIRRRIGTVRTGMFGICCQLGMLSLCLVAAVIPGERVENMAEGYFSAHCPADDVCDGLLPSPPPYLPSSLPSPAPTSLFSPFSTSYVPTLPIPSPSPTVSSGDGSGNLFRPIREAGSGPDSVTLTTSPTPSPNCTTSSVSKVDLNRLNRLLPLVLMLAGIVFARFGLWIFDLAVQQRVQETVAEETRGAVGGVMNAMNSVMDMFHYVLVIVAPRPEHFSILVFISVGMVALGAVLYAVYLRRVRGHFFHCRQCWSACQSGLGRSGHGHTYQVVAREQEVNNDRQNSVVNEESL